MKTETKKIIFEDFMITYKINDRNIKIIDSYKINDKEKMRKVVYNILINNMFFPKDRFIEEYVKEWRTHNMLYHIPLKFFKKHCKDCDLTVGESKFRLFVYSILGRF